MYICNCNPFTDKDVKEALGACPGKAKVAAIYKTCSGGAKPNCCSCMEELKGMVREHNNGLNVAALGDQVSHAGKRTGKHKVSVEQP